MALVRTEINENDEVKNFSRFQLYCKKGPLSKEKRDVFVVGSMAEIRQKFQVHISTCQGPIIRTYNSIARSLEEKTLP
jgi:hypothetical protein